MVPVPHGVSERPRSRPAVRLRGRLEDGDHLASLTEALRDGQPHDTRADDRGITHRGRSDVWSLDARCAASLSGTASSPSPGRPGTVASPSVAARVWRRTCRRRWRSPPPRPR